MTFGAPWFLAAGAAAALGVVALHLLSRRRPPEWAFPTARFVPERDARAASRASRPSDLLVLALRVLAMLLACAAFARPAVERARRPRASVIVADVSRAVRRGAEVADSVRRLRGAGDVVIAFDSGADELASDSVDAVLRRASDGRAGGRGSLSVALIAARRSAERLTRDADTVAIVIVSPLAREEFDAATSAIRARWPAAIALVPVGASVDARAGGIDLRAAPGDPLSATVDLMGGSNRRAGGGGAGVRVVRARLTSADSAWAQQEAGRVLVDWPARVDPGSGRWPPRDTVDTIGAVSAGRAVVIAPFERRWMPDETGGTAAAWWSDGAVAAVERPLGAGCLRSVAIPVPRAGDLVLDPRFRDLVRALAAPCGGGRDFAPVDADTRAWLSASAGRDRSRSEAGAPAVNQAPAQPLEANAAKATVSADPPSPLVRWLLLLTLAALALELVVRRGTETEAVP